MLGPDRVTIGLSRTEGHARKATHCPHHRGVRSIVRGWRHRRYQNHCRPRLLWGVMHHRDDGAVDEGSTEGGGGRPNLAIRELGRAGGGPGDFCGTYRDVGIWEG